MTEKRLLAKLVALALKDKNYHQNSVVLLVL
jgi:hypothetical protein